MREVNLLTYADANYAELQKKLANDAVKTNAFDKIYLRTRVDLESTEFYNQNQTLLNESRGAGYWAWKPYYILETLKEMQEDDILVYMDCGDGFLDTTNMYSFLVNKMENCNMLLTLGAYRNSDWTRRDCFVHMGCDTEEFHNTIQVEAGIIVVKKTAHTVDILNKWLYYCTIPSIVTDQDNICGLPNLEGFKDHRHDQSILTNLKVKHKITSTNEMRMFIECNKNIL